ncbi:uridine kinase [Schnuerera sp.]|uniref:uridine kinase n=1 Tax=Schnuerera sp. TaxID=2794844 RepID=UPI002BEDE23C|nr:uridine kinase [Schnuerera sp.]HSH35126.1 uridine kinase [Schnuerera sp.]
MDKRLLIGIAGGTGSGKSTVSREILKSIHRKNVVIIEQDSYYKNQNHLSFDKRVKTNYDHPFAFDNNLLLAHLKDLLNNKPIEKPIYDFERHTRKKETITVYPKEIIILEGILILNNDDIRNLCDIKIFVDTDSDVRVIRRIQRDIKDRGRTLDSVIHQYMNTVRPAHLQFVEPTKKYADIIIPEGGFNKVAIDIIVTKINSILNK